MICPLYFFVDLFDDKCYNVASIQREVIDWKMRINPL